MVIFYKKWKKCNEIQLTKNKMDSNIRKMTNHAPSLVSKETKNVNVAFYGQKSTTTVRGFNYQPLAVMLLK